MFLDIFVLIVFFVSALIAFLRGFIREALSVVSLGLALAAAYFLGPYLSPIVEGWLGVESGAEVGKLLGILPLDLVAQVTAYGGIFLVVLLVLSLMTHFFAEFIKSLGLGAVDRSLGVVFGLLRAGLVVVVLYLPVHMLVEDDTKKDWFASSKTHFYVEVGANFLGSVMPGDILKEKFDETQDTAQGSDAILGARETLKSMDLLREDLTPAERAELVREKFKSGKMQKAFEGEGYSDEFRGKIDELIEDNIGGSLNE